MRFQRFDCLNPTMTTTIADSPTPAQPTTFRLPLPGLDVQLEAIPLEWLEYDRESVPDDAQAADKPCEVDEILAELQQDLFTDKPRYRAPEVEHLTALAAHVSPASRNPSVSHAPEHAYVAGLSTADLATRVGVWLHAHRGRPGGLSDLDLACQREWSARALGVGFFYGRQSPWLPVALVEKAGRTAPMRQLVLAALCLAMVKGQNGICLSAPDAEMLWRIPASTWWSVVAALEERGLLVRMRRYKNNDVKGQAPVHLCPNWYGPGEELLKMRPLVLALFRKASPERVAEVLAEMHEAERRERCRRRRVITERLQNDKRRRAGLAPLPRPGRPAPAWALRVAASWYDGARQACEAQWARGRGALLAAGVVVAFGVPAPEPDQHDDTEQLERVAALVADGSLEATHEAQDAGGAGAGAEAGEPPAAALDASGGVEPGDPFDPLSLPSNRWTGPPGGQEPRNLEGPKGANGSPGSTPPDASRAAAGGSPASAPAPAATPVSDGWGRLDFAERTVHDCPLAEWGERHVPPDAGDGGAPLARRRPGNPTPAPARRSARADAADALGVVVAQLPIGHPLRGWRPPGDGTC